MKYLALILLSFSIMSTTRTSNAQDAWPRFRGPGSLGVADNPGLPSSWSADANVAWKYSVAGRGWSSPIVWDGRVFMTSVVNEGEIEEPKKGLYFGGNRPKPPTAEHKWVVTCVELESGEPIWERVVHKGIPQTAIHLKNSFASETPVTDGERVYALFGNLGVYCFQLDGTPVWSKSLSPHTTRFGWGTAASPVLHGDRLYLVNDNDEDSYLLALDTRTGNEVWRVPRDEKSNWATPYVWENSLRTEIITPGTGKVRSYDLDGKLLYEFGGCSSITIATPYSESDMLYVSSGYIMDRKKPLFAIRPGGRGDISLGKEEDENDYIAWCAKQAAPYNPTTLLYEGLIYVLLDRGFLTCYDARTGEQVYDKQRLPDGRAFTSSPWAYNGRIFCLNEYGTTYVVKAGRRFELLSTNELAEDDMCMATPAMAGDRLLIRTSERLYCIRNADRASSQ